MEHARGVDERSRSNALVADRLYVEILQFLSVALCGVISDPWSVLKH